jgi:hypothetical protein
MQHVEEYFRIFAAHVNIKGILEAAVRVKMSPMVTTSNNETSTMTQEQRPVKRRKVGTVKLQKSARRSREEIEAAAITAGAAPSA